MSKELEYEINNFANLLHKDCMNLMECLKKQSEDNKPILYLGKHYEKVILPLKEYQKMCNRLEAIDNANPSEALECLESIKDALWDDDFHYQRHSKLLDTIEQALLKAQEQEKEKLFFKNIHNTKVKTPLVSIFEGLSKDERFKFIEHIYYHWEEIKEVLEDKNNELEKENAELKAKAQKEHKTLDIIKEKRVNVGTFIHLTKMLKKDYEQCKALNNTFGANICETEKEFLTEEEFNLLKEVVG